jgi:integrase
VKLTALDVVLGLARPLSAAPTPLESALHSGLAVARQIWAATTWRNNSALWLRYLRYVEEMDAEDTEYSKEETVIAFCQSQAVCPSTRRTYASALKAIFCRLDQPTSLLAMYCLGLQANGATAPQWQAVPATREQVASLLSAAPTLEQRATIHLMWKASARMSDVRSLVKESFQVLRGGCRIVVRWGSTKTTRLQPFSPHNLSVLDAERPMEIIAARVAELRPRQAFTTVDVAAMNRFLRDTLPEAGLTSHSFKRGGITELMGLVEAGAVTLSQVQQAARHQQLESTLRYSGMTAATGAALGTQAATRWL